MYDWNNDGKIDYKDDAFYNNVVVKNEDNKSSTGGNKSNYASSGLSSGWKWFFIICIAYFIIKLIGS